MNTQTHLLLASALLAKNGKSHRYRNLVIILGALTPDILIFAMAGLAGIQGVSGEVLWGEWYFNPPWQAWIDISNSIPLYLVLGLISFAIFKKKKHRSMVLLFVAAALIHILFDIPVHVDDGHAHFWPVTDWRYISSISYWDPKYYGTMVSLIEAVFGLILIRILWKRLTSKPDVSVIRPTLALFGALYLLVPVFYLVMLSD